MRIEEQDYELFVADTDKAETLCRELLLVLEGCEGIDNKATVLSGVAGFVAYVMLAAAEGDKELADSVVHGTFNNIVATMIVNAQRRH